MPPLHPHLQGRNEDPRWIGRKVGRNLAGITRGLSYGAGDVELEPTVGADAVASPEIDPEESVTPPLSSTKPQYPRARPLTGFRKFADALGGGRVGAQVANINARSGLAEAEDIARQNLQGSKFAQDKLMEGVKAGNAESLAILKQHLDTLQAVGLPYTPENLAFVIKMQQQPVDRKPVDLAEEAVTSGFQKQGATNRLNEANALEATARANKINKTELSPEVLAAGLRATIAGADFKEQEAEKLRRFNKTGYVPVPFREGVVDPQGRPMIFQPDEPSRIDLSSGKFIPPRGGGLRDISGSGINPPLSGQGLFPSTSTSPSTEETRDVNGRKAVFDTVTKKFLRWAN